MPALNLGNAEVRFWPFKKTDVFNVEETDWLVVRLNWLIVEFGKSTLWEERTIVLPDSKTFRTAGKSGHELAEHVLSQVKENGGVNFINIHLTADDPQPEYVGDNLLRPVHPDTPAGTYHRDRNGSKKISYNPSLLKQPIQLVATLAHELSHALLDDDYANLPVETDLELELLTDLAAVFLGYGIFMSNSAFEYKQFQDGAVSGWSYQRLGYLPQNQLILATAAFALLKDIPDENIIRFLRPGLSYTYAKAKSHISGQAKLIRRQT
jgi:hypothetical protein